MQAYRPIFEPILGIAEYPWNKVPLSSRFYGLFRQEASWLQARDDYPLSFRLASATEAPSSSPTRLPPAGDYGLTNMVKIEIR
jgi:hypothetical protein